MVVGSGVAGLTAVLEARALGLRTLLVTKAGLPDGNTRWAQGGISVVLGDETGDSVDAHVRDTIVAGAGLCDETAVRAILTEGPAAVRRLRGRGAAFDRGADGHLARTREGGHSAFRVIHSGGDATGAEVERALVEATRADQTAVLPHHSVLSLGRDERGITGAVLVDGTGRTTFVPAGAVLLATGGLGQLYASTTNPPVATGDGLALALRAGARVADLEFVQFHPTALWTGGPGGQRPLVTEAVRGEGGVLVDDDGARLMAGVHPLADMAPRDVVATAITRHLNETGTDHVWLDATGLDDFAERFPTVFASCREIGVDPTRTPIPVTPAAHYLCGGVDVDAEGRTSVPGLYAAGEVARTGLHGANRLASNSLVEGLVTGTWAALAVARERRAARDGGTPHVPETLPAVDRGELQRTASRRLALGRDAAGFDEVDALLDRATPRATSAPEHAADAALTLVARALTFAARERRETRGCHVRHDAPHTGDAWRHGMAVELADPTDDRSMRALTPTGARR
ncbi:MAG: L-aspartate oxidase [Streptosporangiales bacterium]|nr:L-aspartate oxidase [Streptosporangiales bacterium]